MSDTPPQPDRSLLERLNALKPTSVALDKEPNSSLFPAGTATPGRPQKLSNHDELSARLRTLRNLPGGEPTPASPSSPTANPHGAATPQTLGPTSLSSPQPGGRLSLAVAGARDGDDGGDIDPLFMADDTTLDDLLQDLALDARVNEDDDLWGFDPAAESKKVSAALAKLDRDSSTGPKQGRIGHDDESEGEEMGREVENILSQARDEAGIHREQEHGPREEDAEHPKLSQVVSSGTAKPDLHVDDPKLHEAAGFSLPSVPSALVDPALPETEESDPSEQDLDFENDIAKRMAALKGPGSAINTDSFGLPSAPTFQPKDHPVPKVVKRLGYTDEDQMTWCIVCLEDATVRCLGCDDDVYCARCWKDMHVGPAAGYEERGHQWAKFDRR